MRLLSALTLPVYRWTSINYVFWFSNFHFRDLSRSISKCDVGRTVSDFLVTVFLLTCQKTITSLRNLGAMEIFAFVIWVLFTQIIKSNYNYPIKIVFIRLANFQYVWSFANEWKFINYKRAMLNRNNRQLSREFISDYSSLCYQAYFQICTQLDMLISLFKSNWPTFIRYFHRTASI